MKKTTFSFLSLFLFFIGISNLLTAQSHKYSFRVDAPAGIRVIKLPLKLIIQVLLLGVQTLMVNGKVFL